MKKPESTPVDVYTYRDVRLVDSKLGLTSRLHTGNTASMKATPFGVQVVPNKGNPFLVPWSNVDQCVWAE